MLLIVSITAQAQKTYYVSTGVDASDGNNRTIPFMIIIFITVVLQGMLL